MAMGGFRRYKRVAWLRGGEGARLGGFAKGARKVRLAGSIGWVEECQGKSARRANGFHTLNISTSRIDLRGDLDRYLIKTGKAHGHAMISVDASSLVCSDQPENAHSQGCSENITLHQIASPATISQSFQATQLQVPHKPDLQVAGSHIIPLHPPLISTIPPNRPRWTPTRPPSTSSAVYPQPTSPRT